MKSKQVLKTSQPGATGAPGASRRLVFMREIRAVARQIAERFRPEKIILFGSYAAGTPGPDSDVDLLVVMETPLSPRQQAVEIVRAIDYHFGLDLIVRTPAQMAERLALGDFFLQEVIETGRVLYARSDEGMGG
ncbi:MAG: nucleotidyltransferase domain-containing protein [Anaerolineae bacterium]|nr:nucleotidyltransferase domain-containing protein [Anaerolineae bacterium]